MPIETELKLRIAPDDLARLKRHPFLRALSTERAVSRHLYSIYFDTPDLWLNHQKMALRLRRVGSRWLQTLKGGGEVQAGLHLRNEWETEVANEDLDFSSLDAIGATHLPDSVRNELRPLFVTDFTRSIRLLKYQGALIELGLDSGEIRSGELKHLISELELELKAGEPLQLFRLALALLDLVPLEIESVSKAEYGYRLRSPVKPRVSKAQIPKIDPHTSIEDALQSMIWSCLLHLQENVPGAINKTDDEYLHQVRVALRRLRVVLKFAENLCPDAELKNLSDSIAQLGSTLGRSREWDVFVTETLPLLSKDWKADVSAELMAFIGDCEKQRSQSHQLVYASLQTVDFQRLLLHFGVWMNGEYWNKAHGHSNGVPLKNEAYYARLPHLNPLPKAGEEANESLREFRAYGTLNLKQFTEEILLKYEQKIYRRGDRIQGDVNSEQLHKLRIACKNLRYSIELFGPIAGLDNSRNKLDALVKLQDILGKLHDNAVALDLLDELSPSSTQQLILLIRDGIESIHSKNLKEFRKEWKSYRESVE